ncbi:MAG TPA: hypothetical protein VH969_03670 [Actinophytocola sp.]|uniref:hypothetical protein n=1 Tax=Actinophytocola sp. TaxID=1872138 RepID=UPI002F92E22B
MTARPLTVVLCCAALALAGCTSAANDQAGQETTTTTTPTTTETSPSLRPECADVADAAQALVTEVGKLATQDATVGDVKAAADDLSQSFADARGSLGPEAQAHLDEAGQALQRVQDALGAQPVNKAGLRQAATDLLASLGDAATVCAAGSATTTPTDTTGTTGTETADTTETPETETETTTS